MKVGHKHILAGIPVIPIREETEAFIGRPHLITELAEFALSHMTLLFWLSMMFRHTSVMGWNPRN